MLVHPNFDPVAFSFGPFSLGGLTLGPFAVRWYGLMYLAGFVLFVLLGRARARCRPRTTNSTNPARYMSPYQRTAIGPIWNAMGSNCGCTSMPPI
jgi:prolipoprotein diacylglyceryltransferase